MVRGKEGTQAKTITPTKVKAMQPAASSISGSNIASKRYHLERRNDVPSSGTQGTLNARPSILDSCRNRSPQHRVSYRYAHPPIEDGCVQLRWSDIDWLSSTVAIERACVRQRVDECKTEGSRRTLTVAPELMEALQLWKQSSQFPEPGSFIFASPFKLGKQPISYTEIRRELQRAAVAANTGPVSTHAFRHTFRTWMDSLGAPVGVQQRAMRHASVTTTMNTYGDALPDDLRRVHEQVSELALKASDCPKQLHTSQVTERTGGGGWTRTNDLGIMRPSL
jgi:hypothetical protein